jgi:hypothetical protein
MLHSPSSIFNSYGIGRLQKAKCVTASSSHHDQELWDEAIDSIPKSDESSLDVDYARIKITKAILFIQELNYYHVERAKLVRAIETTALRALSHRRPLEELKAMCVESIIEQR